MDSVLRFRLDEQAVKHPTFQAHQCVMTASSSLPVVYTNDKAKQAAKDLYYSYFYARYVLKSRWDGPYKDLAEETIAKDGEYAYSYASDILKARWDGPYKDLAEERIAKEPFYAYSYALDILKARWDGPYKDLAEKSIAKDPWHAYSYASDILNSRWDGPAKDLAEKTILNSGYKDDYIAFLREHDIPGYASLMGELSDKGLIKKIEVTKLASSQPKEQHMGSELHFASEEQALKHLANLTGRKVMVAAGRFDADFIEVAKVYVSSYRKAPPRIFHKRFDDTSRVGSIEGVSYMDLDEAFQGLMAANYGPGKGHKTDFLYEGTTSDGADFAAWNYENGPAFRWKPKSDRNKQQELKEYEDSDQYQEDIYGIDKWSFWVHNERGLGLLMALLGDKLKLG